MPPVEHWSPPFALHVRGEYTRRVWDGERFEEQTVKATCSLCKQTMETRCDSGRVREKIAKWAVLHLHKQ